MWALGTRAFVRAASAVCLLITRVSVTHLKSNLDPAFFSGRAKNISPENSALEISLFFKFTILTQGFTNSRFCIE